MSKKLKKKMVVMLNYSSENGAVDIDELYDAKFDKAKGPKVKKEKNGDITISSNDEKITLPITMWNHGAGFGSMTLEFSEED